ncbi:hypothetical protein ACFOG5_10555 [Pedobacter fastidiosus]|uniref:Uncharacterized protein n=1 Tax=Pedobacter fastidiosus TaxID=2765361 RepID=A0ABR7KWA6_9SPHI|nr:hypothetical protein [Pedobacter fastidiosus]MBC6112194.1 hypothetical protein [Pedobacter fastidiosus]
MKFLKFYATSVLLVVCFGFAKAGSGCIDNNHGGDFIYSTLISGTTYDYDGAKVPHSYDTTTPCNSEIQGTSSYASCNIYKSGVLYGTGSFVDYNIVNCPLDDNSIYLILGLFIVGSYHIKNSF